MAAGGQRYTRVFVYDDWDWEIVTEFYRPLNNDFCPGCGLLVANDPNPRFLVGEDGEEESWVVWSWEWEDPFERMYTREEPWEVEEDWYQDWSWYWVRTTYRHKYWCRVAYHQPCLAHIRRCAPGGC